MGDKSPKNKEKKKKKQANKQEKKKTPPVAISPGSGKGVDIHGKP